MVLSISDDQFVFAREVDCFGTPIIMSIHKTIKLELMGYPILEEFKL